MRHRSIRTQAIASTCLLALLAGCTGRNRPDSVSDAPAAQAPQAAATPASAAEDAESSIVVTAQKRVEQPNLSVPSPVTVISSEQLDRAVPAAAPPPPPPPSPPPPSQITGKAISSARMSAAPGSSQANGMVAYIPAVAVPTPESRERYDGKEVSPVKQVKAEPVSTFSVDVDTGSYSNSRRYLAGGAMPPKDGVRTEELINYFRYDYPLPAARSAPFSVTTDMMITPWNPETRLLRIGLKGYDLPRKGRPPANLVFLVDVSGSMSSADKLPLVKSALSGLAGELGRQDKVSIVVYAGAAGLVLEPTNDPAKIRAALDRLSAGGSTAGGAGLQLAYQIARDNLIQGGVNRILLATDGDFNVGVSDTKSLLTMVERERESGITLTTLGFGQGNYNEAMMEQVADKGNGNYAYIDSALEAKKALGEQMSSTLFTIAKDVKIQVEFNPAQVSQYRLLGYENRALREEDFNNDKVDAGDIGAGHQVTAIYEVVPVGFKGWTDARRYEETASTAPATSRAGEVAFVKLRYKLPDGTTSKLIERPVPAMLMWQRRAASPDFRFATAVAAFGQKLRGDPLLGTYGYRDIGALAGEQQDFWRQEFLKLVTVADGLSQQ